MCARGSKSQLSFGVLPDFGAGRNTFCNTFEFPMLELTFRGFQNGKTLENWTIGSEVR